MAVKRACKKGLHTIPVVLDWTGNGIKSHRWITDNLKGTTHRDPYLYLASMGITEEQFEKDNLNGLDKPHQIVEDENTMKFTSTTAKAAVRDYIQQAIDKKVIDKSWLEKFDNGTMTSGDYEGLKIIIAQRSA